MTRDQAGDQRHVAPPVRSNTTASLIYSSRMHRQLSVIVAPPPAVRLWRAIANIQLLYFALNLLWTVGTFNFKVKANVMIDEFVRTMRSFCSCSGLISNFYFLILLCERKDLFSKFWPLVIYIRKNYRIIF